MVIRVPTPEMTPPGISQADRAVYAITKRSVAEGQFVREGDAVFEMVIENPLRLWTNVPERYADRVQVGQTVRVSVSPEPGKEFEGKVVRINPSVDPVSRTFQVETQIPNDRRLLRPGGFAKASIITDSASEASVVPTESIVQFAGVTKVFVIEDGKARAINDIVTREEGQGWVEVVSKSLPAQAVVVTTGQSQLADGTPVVVRVPETATDHSMPAEAEPAETKADRANPAEPNSAEPKK
jgi:RND family efflux transporter MFP subunit